MTKSKEYIISGIDGFEADYIEDILKEDDIPYELECFMIQDGIYEVVITSDDITAIKYLLKSNL